MNYKWEEELAIGIGELDVQHRQIISIIQKLVSCVKNDYKGAEESIDELDKCLTNHFEMEEAYMIGYLFPGYKEHRLEHDEFKRKFGEAKKLIKSKKCTDEKIAEISHEVSEKLIEHINTTDKKMADFIRKKRK